MKWGTHPVHSFQVPGVNPDSGHEWEWKGSACDRRLVLPALLQTPDTKEHLPEQVWKECQSNSADFPHGPDISSPTRNPETEGVSETLYAVLWEHSGSW